LMVISSVAILATAGYFALAKKDAAVKFKTEKVERGSIEEAVTATGALNAIKTVQVGAQVSGMIKKLFVDFNSTVKEGQLIAEIDPALFMAQLEQARANLASARANVEKSAAALSDAQRTMARNNEMYLGGLIARSDKETAETNYDSAKAQLAVSRAQVEQSEAALRLAETNLRYTKIVAPVDGVVISRNVDAGQTVAASFQTPTLFTIAQDLTKMQIDTNVNEADIGKIREGQKVAFTVDAYPDETFNGYVSQVRNAPVTVQNVVTYDVVIRVDNSDFRLKPGMTANASIITARKDGVTKVPNAALRFKMGEREKTRGEKKGYGVWILENGQPKRVMVKLGVGDGTFTEIVKGDIAEGQEVIVDAPSSGKKPGGQSGPRMF
ncbi:MAG: efflux RND transporter periplasmic adaptor subunit, partial [Nitrospinae bacterium]|nr:efflux RND transporter periplasmic adaptor subunit [Nitrospinota bacterium]